MQTQTTCRQLQAEPQQWLYLQTSSRSISGVRIARRAFQANFLRRSTPNFSEHISPNSARRDTQEHLFRI